MMRCCKSFKLMICISYIDVYTSNIRLGEEIHQIAIGRWCFLENPLFIMREQLLCTLAESCTPT